MRKMLDTAAETERVRQLQDREAPRYDRQIAFFERILFAGGREWVCRQASGRVLEIAAGTARNLPYYPADVSLTAVELSEEMLVIARGRAREPIRHRSRLLSMETSPYPAHIPQEVAGSSRRHPLIPACRCWRDRPPASNRPGTYRACESRTWAVMKRAANRHVLWPGARSASSSSRADRKRMASSTAEAPFGQLISRFA